MEVQILSWAPLTTCGGHYRAPDVVVDNVLSIEYKKGMDTVSRKKEGKTQRTYWGCRCDPDVPETLGTWANQLNSKHKRTGASRLTERAVLELLVRYAAEKLKKKELQVGDLLEYEREGD